MKVCFVNLYKNTKFSFDDEIYLKIKEIDREFKILAPVDSNNLQYCKNYNYLNSKGINIDEKVIDYAIINKIFGNKYINSFNELYEKTKEENIDAFIIPLSNWKNLEYIKLSYLQLSNKNILFVLDEINKFEFDKFLSLVKYLDRFRNIHIGILNSNQERIDLYNLHDLRNENFEVIPKNSNGFVDHTNDIYNSYLKYESVNLTTNINIKDVILVDKQTNQNITMQELLILLDNNNLTLYDHVTETEINQNLYDSNYIFTKNYIFYIKNKSS